MSGARSQSPAEPAESAAELVSTDVAARQIGSMIDGGRAGELGQWLSRRGFEPVTPAGRDPVVAWLVGLSRARRWRVAVVLAAVGLLPALVSVVEGTFVLGSIRPSLAQDVGYWNTVVVAIPAMVILINGYFRRISIVPWELVLNGAFDFTKGEWNELRRYAARVYGGVLVTALPIVYAALMALYSVFYYVMGGRGESGWHGPGMIAGGNLAGWVWVPVNCVLYYLMWAWGVRIVGTGFVMRRFLRFAERLAVFHPDGRGGWTPLGELSTQLIGLVLVLGAITAIGVYSNTHVYGLPLTHPRTLNMLTYVVVGVPLAFILPLSYGAMCMKRIWRTQARDVARQLAGAKRDDVGVRPDADPPDAAVLLREQEILATMTLVPVRVSEILRFAGSFCMSVLLILLSAYIDGIV